MKYLFLWVLALSLSKAWAQKLMVKPPQKLPVAGSYTPPNTYRLSEKSDIVYAQTDNMPNADIKMQQDSGSVYRIPNPLRRQAKPQSQKP